MSIVSKTEITTAVENLKQEAEDLAKQYNKRFCICVNQISARKYGVYVQCIDHLSKDLSLKSEYFYDNQKMIIEYLAEVPETKTQENLEVVNNTKQTLTKTQNEVMEALNKGCLVQVVFNQGSVTRAILSPADTDLNKRDERRKLVNPKTIQALLNQGYLEVFDKVIGNSVLKCQFVDIKF